MQRSRKSNHVRSESASTKRNSMFSLWSSSATNELSPSSSHGTFSSKGTRLSSVFSSVETSSRLSTSTLADGSPALTRSISLATKKHGKSASKDKSNRDAHPAISLMQNLEAQGLVDKEKIVPKLPSRNRKRLISGPTDFYHVRHSSQGQVPDRMSKDDFSAEFAALKQMTVKHTCSSQNEVRHGHKLSHDAMNAHNQQQKTMDGASKLKKAPPLRPRRSDEMLDHTKPQTPKQDRRLYRRSRSAEDLAGRLPQTPVPFKTTPSPPLPPKRASSKRAMTSQSNQVSARQIETGMPLEHDLSSTTTVLTPFADSGIMLQQYGRELKQIPEEPETGDGLRTQTSQSLADQYIAEVLGWKAPISQRLSTVPATPEPLEEQNDPMDGLLLGRRDSIASETLGAARRSRKVASRRGSQSSIPIPILGSQEQRVRKRRSSLRSELSETQLSALMGELDWEDDIDYCYDHHMEAHCDLEWERQKQQNKFQSGQTAVSEKAARHDSAQTPLEEKRLVDLEQARAPMEQHVPIVRKAAKKKNPYEFESTDSSDAEVDAPELPPKIVSRTRLLPTGGVNLFGSAPPTPELDHQSIEGLNSPADSEACTPPSNSHIAFDFQFDAVTPASSTNSAGAVDTALITGSRYRFAEKLANSQTIGSFDNYSSQHHDDLNMYPFAALENRSPSESERPTTSPGHYTRDSLTFDALVKSDSFRNSLLMPLKLGHKRRSQSAGDLILSTRQYDELESAILSELKVPHLYTSNESNPVDRVMPKKPSGSKPKSLKLDTIVAQLRTELGSQMVGPACPKLSHAAATTTEPKVASGHSDRYASAKIPNKPLPSVPSKPTLLSADKMAIAADESRDLVGPLAVSRPQCTKASAAKRRSAFYEDLDASKPPSYAQTPSLPQGLTERSHSIVTSAVINSIEADTQVEKILPPLPLKIETELRSNVRSKGAKYEDVNVKTKEKDDDKKSKSKRRTMSLAGIKFNKLRNGRTSAALKE